MLRGVDGFLGTQDDTAADGRSSIGSVTISGNQVGSNFQLRAVPGHLDRHRRQRHGRRAAVRAPQQLPGDAIPAGQPGAIQVVNSRPVEDGRVWLRDHLQPGDRRPGIPNAPNIARVQRRRDAGRSGAQHRLHLPYNPDTFVSDRHFNRNVTDRSLPVPPGNPRPCSVSSSTPMSAARRSCRLDGNNDGKAGDDFGRRLCRRRGRQDQWNNPNTVAGIDFYGAGSLDLFLDSNADSDDPPDLNSHTPAACSATTRTRTPTRSASAATSTCTASLPAPVRFSAWGMQGIALQACCGIYDASGTPWLSGGGDAPTLVANGPVRLLPAADASNVGDVTGNDEYLIPQTGTYYIRSAPRSRAPRSTTSTTCSTRSPCRKRGRVPRSRCGSSTTATRACGRFRTRATGSRS